MDDKASWNCDRAFYARKFQQFASSTKIKLDFEHLTERQLQDFHAHLIEKELFLQFVVKAPLYGNGTVRISKWGRSWVDDLSRGSNGTEAAIAYIAKIGDKSVGVPSTYKSIDDASTAGGKIAFEGLTPGQKYKVSIVPYKIYGKTNAGLSCTFSNIVAF